jgi:RHS repeat-associated protein
LIEVRKNQKVVAQYGYDPTGLRVVKRAGGETTHYVFEGDEPIFEKKVSSGKIRSYIYALGKHLARVDGAIGDTTTKVYYYHTDQVGSIRKITDQQGKVVWDTQYEAFGNQFNQTGSIEELHSFTGKELDPDTGLYYFNARWYDSELGRFVSEDPEGDPNSPNLYGYCSNNPLIHTVHEKIARQELKEIQGKYSALYNGTVIPTYKAKLAPLYPKDSLGEAFTTGINVGLWSAATAKLPTERELNSAVSEWSRMQKSLAPSKAQAAKFNTGTIVYDAGTGKYYYGMNRGVQISGDTLNSYLSKMLPEKSLNNYKLGNCAEVDAVNQALNKGANIRDLYMYTVDVNSGTSKAMCENCIYTFKGRVADVLSR